jgi:hypothetical protein
MTAEAFQQNVVNSVYNNVVAPAAQSVVDSGRTLTVDTTPPVASSM